MDGCYPPIQHASVDLPKLARIPDPTAVNVILDRSCLRHRHSPYDCSVFRVARHLDLSNEEVIDFGCGSGILAVAALKLGAKNVTGIDIDYQAIDASRASAERNDVADKSLVLTEDQPADLKADVLVANILACPLRELAP